jgi:hypothetical protein
MTQDNGMDAPDDLDFSRDIEITKAFRALGALLDASEMATLKGDFDTAARKFNQAKDFCHVMSRDDDNMRWRLS